jgi:opacity protein-like surface antigen
MLTNRFQKYGKPNLPLIKQKSGINRLPPLCFWLMVIACSVCGLAQFEAHGQIQYPTPAKDWSFDLVPYLWLATYDGSFDVPNTPQGTSGVQTDSGFATHISAAAMATAHIRYRDVGVLLDGAWLQLKTDGGDPSGLFSGIDLKSDIAYGAAAATYRLAPMGPLEIDLLGGARVWYVRNELDFKGGKAQGVSVDDTRTWVDPIVGAKLRYGFSKHWFATVLGDAGGFGVGSDLTWNVFGGVGYSFSDLFSLTLGYRYMHIDYEKSNFKMDANVHGFLLGAGFHF